jgi:serine/threonine protein kinase
LLTPGQQAARNSYVVVGEVVCKRHAMPPIARLRRAPRAESVLTIPRPRVSMTITSPFEREVVETSHETFGPYLIYEQLGEGGMAKVHRAELVCAEGVRKTVALKRMKTALSEDATFVDAFVREAQLASRLRHPNIAQAFELGKIAGTYFISMELVAGPTLAQIMRQSQHAAGAVPLPIVLEILIQLLDALEHVHDLRDEGGKPLQLVHRDVSPANVIVARTGTAKLIDFGIAKHRSARMATEAGVIKGKHAYLAPEYTYGRLDHRADLFALGVVAHELLTGRRLFVAETEIDSIRAVRERHIHPPSRFNPAVPHDLDAIIMTALQRDPERRWQNAGAMRAALVALVRELGAAVKGREIHDWIEWAFTQPDRRTTPVGQMLAGLTPSMEIDSIVEPVLAASGPAQTVPGKRSRPPTSPSALMSPIVPLVQTRSRALAAGTGSTPKIDPYVLERAQAMARLSAPVVGKGMLRAHAPRSVSRAETQVVDRRPRGAAVLLALVALTLQFNWLDLAWWVDRLP